MSLRRLSRYAWGRCLLLQSHGCGHASKNEILALTRQFPFSSGLDTWHTPVSHRNFYYSTDDARGSSLWPLHLSSFNDQEGNKRGEEHNGQLSFNAFTHNIQLQDLFKHSATIGGLRQVVQHQKQQYRFEAPARGFCSTSTSAPAPAPPKASSNSAEECDDALEKYDNLRTRYASRFGNPPSYKSVEERLRAILSTAWSAIVWTTKFAVSIPGRLLSIARMSGQDWADAWTKTKKVVKEEAHHYWVGTKLLATDAKIAARLAVKAATGKSLTRRERRQLTRTTADMFRLVPFMVILLIPFMELALPVLLRLFPNMLPSTYENKLQKEEKLKKGLSVRIEVAKFLQDTVAEMAKDINKRGSGNSATGADLYQFMNKVRSGEKVENYELLRFAPLFNDELTLDNLERVQLVSMCQFVGITPFGTDAFLRSRLRRHLGQIKQDDYEIKSEGLENLTSDELRQACRARGMKAPYGEGAVMYMQREMRDWLDLSLNRGLPSSLLLLSQVFNITSHVADKDAKTRMTYDSLKDTLSTLSEDVIKDVGFEVGASSKTAALEQKLEQIKREEQLIAEEAEDESESKGSDARATPESTRVAASASASIQDVANEAMFATAQAAARAVAVEADAGVARDVLGMEGSSAEEKAAKLAAAKEQRMKDLISALAVLASTSGVAKERAAFMDLIRNEVDMLNQNVAQQGSASLVFTGKAIEALRPEHLPEDVEAKVPSKLSDRVSSILHRIESELDQVDSAIGQNLHLLDLDNDGIVSKRELESALRYLRQHLGEDDLKLLLERFNATTEDSQIPVAALMALAQSDDSQDKKRAKNTK